MRTIDRLAAAAAHLFYRLDVIGSPPVEGPLLLLPNHPNALLDPALVIATTGRPVRFLAKSTLFSGPFAPLMKAAGAIPVHRPKDGSDARRNAEMFAAVDAALASGEAICIFPEGISHSTGRLEPLRTGAARMALSALAAGTPVRLVPIGINLEQKTIFRSRATVAYGPAFEPAATASVGALTAEIAEHMRMLIVEADPGGDAALVERLDGLYRHDRGPGDGERDGLERRRAIADGIQRLRAARPEWYASALVQLRRYDDRLRRFGLADHALDWTVTQRDAWRFLAREAPRALVLGPIGLAAAIVFVVPYGLTAAAARLSKDSDVTATAKVLAGSVIYVLWILALAAAIGYLRGPSAALLTAVLAPVLAVAGLFAIERETSAWHTARAWLALRSAHPTTRKALRRRRAELAGVLEEMNDWLRGYD